MNDESPSCIDETTTSKSIAILTKDSETLNKNVNQGKSHQSSFHSQPRCQINPLV